MAVKQSGAVALVDLLTWAMTYAEAMVPAQALALIQRLTADEVEAEFNAMLELDGFDGADLRRLAASAMAVAMVHDAAEVQETPTHGPHNAAKK